MTRTHGLALAALASLTGMAGLDLMAVDAKPVSYELPAESAALRSRYPKRRSSARWLPLQTRGNTQLMQTGRFTKCSTRT